MSMLVKPVQTYVINLDRSTKRMAHMGEVLSAYGLEFIRIPAVEPILLLHAATCLIRKLHAS